MVLKRQWLALKVLLAGEAFLVPCRAARRAVMNKLHEVLTFFAGQVEKSSLMAHV